METDDVDSVLVQQLSSLATSDKESLIRQFQQVLGIEMPEDMCTFFLDMSNWSLQDAIGAYYDHGERSTMNDVSAIQHGYLNMQFVNDVTIGEGESVPPLTRFVKSWRVKNTGSMHWPDGCRLCFMEGNALTETTQSAVDCVPPGAEIDIGVEMVSPPQPGIYQSRWQLITSSQLPFGESIWCIVQVDTNGILDITQQMARTCYENKVPQQRISAVVNPFVLDNSCTSSIPMDPPHDRNYSNMMMRSSPMTIQQREGTDGLPCTPCTPPDDQMER